MAIVRKTIGSISSKAENHGEKLLD